MVRCLQGQKLSDVLTGVNMRRVVRWCGLPPKLLGYLIGNRRVTENIQATPSRGEVRRLAIGDGIVARYRLISRPNWAESSDPSVLNLT